MTKDGYKDIEKLKVGNIVLTYNEEKGINEYKKILDVFIYKNKIENLYTISTNNFSFKLTGFHRIYIRRNGAISYIAANKAKIGDYVKYADGTYHRIIKISYVPQIKTVYNLHVEDNNNFYVGSKGVLVHNAAYIGK